MDLRNTAFPHKCVPRNAYNEGICDDQARPGKDGHCDTVGVMINSSDVIVQCTHYYSKMSTEL